MPRDKKFLRSDDLEAIRGAVDAASRILVVFQPHLSSRT